MAHLSRIATRTSSARIAAVTLAVGALACAPLVMGLRADVTSQAPSAQLLACADSAPKDGTVSTREMRTGLMKLLRAIAAEVPGCDMDGDGVTTTNDATVMVQSIRELLVAISSNREAVSMASESSRQTSSRVLDVLRVVASGESCSTEQNIERIQLATEHVLRVLFEETAPVRIDNVREEKFQDSIPGMRGYITADIIGSNRIAWSVIKDDCSVLTSGVALATDPKASVALFAQDFARVTNKSADNPFASSVAEISKLGGPLAININGAPTTKAGALSEEILGSLVVALATMHREHPSLYLISGQFSTIAFSQLPARALYDVSVPVARRAMHDLSGTFSSEHEGIGLQLAQLNSMRMLIIQRLYWIKERGFIVNPRISVPLPSERSPYSNGGLSPEVWGKVDGGRVVLLQELLHQHIALLEDAAALISVLEKHLAIATSNINAPNGEQRYIDAKANLNRLIGEAEALLVMVTGSDNVGLAESRMHAMAIDDAAKAMVPYMEKFSIATSRLMPMVRDDALIRRLSAVNLANQAKAINDAKTSSSHVELAMKIWRMFYAVWGAKHPLFFPSETMRAEATELLANSFDKIFVENGVLGPSQEQQRRAFYRDIAYAMERRQFAERGMATLVEALRSEGARLISVIDASAASYASQSLTTDQLATLSQAALLAKATGQEKELGRVLIRIWTPLPQAIQGRFAHWWEDYGVLAVFPISTTSTSSLSNDQFESMETVLSTLGPSLTRSVDVLHFDTIGKYAHAMTPTMRGISLNYNLLPRQKTVFDGTSSTLLHEIGHVIDFEHPVAKTRFWKIFSLCLSTCMLDSYQSGTAHEAQAEYFRMWFMDNNSFWEKSQKLAASGDLSLLDIYVSWLDTLGEYYDDAVSAMNTSYPQSPATWNTVRTWRILAKDPSTGRASKITDGTDTYAFTYAGNYLSGMTKN